MKRNESKLWAYFSAMIFAIMLITALIMTFIAFLLLHLGFLNPENGNILAPISFILFISVLIGTILSMVVGQKILKPIDNFSIIAKEVAKGDFSVRVKENNRVKELKEFTDIFNIMIHELSSIETLRNDFVVNVSHEFKTPISTIEGYATLLLDESINDNERKEYLQTIIESTKQLSNLTGNILMLSRLEHQEILPEKKEFRLDEQIRQAILMLENLWDQQNIEFDLDLPYTLYKGNDTMLMHVWLNLINNAIKFSYNQGTIHIRLSQDSYNTIFEIKDEGCGMNLDTQKHIFDKFYQGDTSRKAEGNGLGLPLCKKIIELHKGSIEVNSKLDIGTEFKVKLPL